MDAIYHNLAQLVCKGQLKLVSGDILSINTEESTYDFAMLLARQACKMTNLTVNIVVTEDGKVTQTVPIEPDLLDIQRPKPKMPVMCRILDLNNFPYFSLDDPMETVKNLVNINKFGNLSEPLVLDRKISVPWAVVPFPSLSFAQALLENAENGVQHKLFELLYRLDQEDPESFWENQANLIKYRIKQLNKHEDGMLTIDNYRSNFIAKICKKSNWAGGHTTLKNNRTFYTSLPAQNVHTTFDNKSAEGTIVASRDFTLFGQIVKNARFVISEGRVTTFSASEGYQALEAYFKADKNANIVSGISLCDEDTTESKYLTMNVHPHFNMEGTSSLLLGGINIDTLENIYSNEDINDLNIEEALVKLVIPFGNDETKVTLNGQIIMDDGVFRY